MTKTIQRLNSRQKYFVDRIEPRAAYHEIVDKRIKNLDKADSDNEVIHFHGIGGIGKTTLLQELIRESYNKYADMHHKSSYKNPVFLRLDFDNAGCRSIIGALEILYQQLIDQRPNWQFPNYSHAKYIYAVRTGQIHSDLDRKAFLKKYPFIKTFTEIGEELPTIGIVFKIARKLTDAVEAIELNTKKRVAKFSAFQNELLATEILEEMPRCLCDDICKNIGKNELILLFVDTYEKFWLQENTFILHDAFYYEFWFKQLLREIPNAVCVIAGCDAIKWHENDPDPFWKQHMESHVIELLSERDTFELLIESDIQDESLRHELWKLTNGDPFHLELCIKRYRMLSYSNTTISIADFGTTTRELVGRIVNSLGGENLKTLAYIMGTLHQWNIDLLSHCASTLRCIVPTQAEFNRVMNVCNVTRKNDNMTTCYTLHSRQATILRDCLLEMYRNQLVESILSYCDKHTDELDVCLPAAIHAAGKDESRITVLKYITQLYHQFMNDHRLDRAVTCLDQLFMIYSKENPDSKDTLEIEYRRCKLNRYAGRLKQAKEDVETAIEHIERVCGEDSAEYIHILCEKAAILQDIKGESCEISEIIENAYQIAQRIFQPCDKNLLEVESYYAVILMNQKEYQKAKAIIESILKKLKSRENTSNSALAKANLLAGNLYLQMGSLDLAKTYLEKTIRLTSPAASHVEQAIYDAAQISLEGTKQQEHKEPHVFYSTQAETCKKIYGEQHFMAWCYQNNSAVFLIKDGQIPEANRQLSECQRAMSTLLGETNYRTIRIHNNLIACGSLIENADFSQCSSKQRELFHIVEEQLNNLETIVKVQHNLGIYLYEMDKVNEALVIQENIMKECLRKYEKNDMAIERCISALLRTYHKMGRTDLMQQTAKELSLSCKKVDSLINVPLSDLLYFYLF